MIDNMDKMDKEDKIMVGILIAVFLFIVVDFILIALGVW